MSNISLKASAIGTAIAYVFALSYPKISSREIARTARARIFEQILEKVGEAVLDIQRERICRKPPKRRPLAAGSRYSRTAKHIILWNLKEEFNTVEV